MTELNPEAAPEAVKDDVIVPTPGSMIRRPGATEYKADARDGDGDGLVQDGTPFERPVEATSVEVEEVAQEIVVEEQPKKKPAPKPASKGTELPAVELHASALVESKVKRNSLTVAWVQDRLNELGYPTAREDIRGWYSEGTVKAVEAFQKDRGLEVGAMTRSTLDALIEGTKASVV